MTARKQTIIVKALLNIGKNKSLISVVYSTLILCLHFRSIDRSELIQENSEHLISLSDSDIFTLCKTRSLDKRNYYDSLDNETIQRIKQLVIENNFNFELISQAIIELIISHNNLIPLSYTPTNLKLLISEIIDTYILKQKELHSIYDFNARLGDLVSSIALHSEQKTDISNIYLEESTPLSAQIGSMLASLLMPKKLIRYMNRNSLINSFLVEAKIKVDCVVSCPRLSTILSEDESQAIKPYLSVPLAPRQKINSPESIYIQLAKYCLNKDGIAIIIVSDGFLNRQGYDYEIRKYLHQKDLVETVISLPNNIYPGAKISTSILILNKNKSIPGEIKMLSLNRLQLNRATISESVNCLSKNHKTKASEQIYTLVSTPDIQESNYSFRPIDYQKQESRPDLGQTEEIKKQLNESHSNYLKKYDEWNKLLS